MALEEVIAIIGFVYLLFYLAINIKSRNNWLKGCQVLLVSTGLLFMLLIPAIFSMTSFPAKFWIYVMWMLRIYGGYLLLWLIFYTFKQWDIKTRFRL